MDYPYGMFDTFRPTASRLKTDRLMRSDGYTTNGHWAFMTDFEPDFIKKLADNKSKPSMKSLLDMGKKAKCEMKLVNSFKFLGNIPAVKFENGKRSCWFNAYYVSLFDKIAAGVEKKFYQEDETSPLFVKDESGKIIIGMIMRIKTE